MLVLNMSMPYINGVGLFVCPGYWDKDVGNRVKCVFQSNGEDVNRIKWVMEAVEEDAVPTPDFIVVLSKDVIEKGPKEAATMVVSVAQSQEYSIPRDEGRAIQEVGRMLMATKSEGKWDIEAVFKMLDEEYPKTVS